MSKKMIVLLAVALLMLAMAATAFAAPIAAANNTQYGTGYGGCGNGYAGQCYSLMRDTDGSLVGPDVFEQNLDQAIVDGIILEADRAYFMDRYDYCSANGGIMRGGRGCGGWGRR